MSWPPFRCCIACIGNPHLQEFIKQTCEIGMCTYCKSPLNNTVDTDTLGLYIRKKILSSYEVLKDHPSVYFWADQNPYKRFTPREVFAREKVISDELGGTSMAQELFTCLMSPSNGEPDITSEELECGRARLTVPYDPYGVFENRYVLAWDAFKHQVKYFSRFFDLPQATTPRAALLESIASLMRQMEVTIPAGEVFWRGRVTSTAIPDDLPGKFAAIGPPPPDLSLDSRMSPRGIAYLYVSESRQAVEYELRPEEPTRVLIGQLRARKPLRILDLTFTPEIQTPSIFSAGYDASMPLAGVFLEQFTEEISRPTDRSDVAADYLATQILSEYARVIGFDGIRYRSSIHPTGINQTIFCGPPHECYRRSRYEFSPPFGGGGHYELDYLPQIDEWFEIYDLESTVISSKTIRPPI